MEMPSDLETSDEPVPKIAIALPSSIWKRRLISELNDSRNKKKAMMELCNKASSLKWKRRPRAVTDEGKRRAIFEAEKFKSDLLFCRGVMRPTYVYYYSVNLWLPADFSKKHLKDIRGSITL